MNGTRHTFLRVLAWPAAVLGAALAANGAEIEVIYSEVDGHPTAQAPGQKDLAGNPVATQFKALEDLTVSHDGRYWLMKGRNLLGSDLEGLMLLGSDLVGDAFVQEGQPVLGGQANEVYDFFDGEAGFDSSNNLAYGARARNGIDSEKEKVVVYDLANGTHTVQIMESTPLQGLLDSGGASGDETMGNSANGIHLLDNGNAGYVAVTINNISSFNRPALMYKDQAHRQSGISMIGGDFWDSFDSDDFSTTPDGTTWVAQGDDEGATTTDDILVVNDVVVIRENTVIAGSSITADAVFHTNLLANGDWYARGDDTANNDWAVRNGVVLAATGDPITTVRGAENWGDQFVAFTGNRKGDWLLAGNTNNGDPATDEVIVYNGSLVVMREGDPVDLDGNGMFDDDAFIGRGNLTSSAFAPDDMYLTDSGLMYAIVHLRDAAGNDKGSIPSFGTPDCFVRLLVDPCPWDLTEDGTVDVFDLFMLLNAWGTDGAGSVIALPRNVVDIFDLFELLGHWGDC